MDSVTTNYTLDLNSGLTQVLDDGTNIYTYGLGRISQTNVTTEYFLGDALGSVRQLTDSTGEITLAKGYDPYGEVTYTAGTSQTEYGFTGEQYSVETQMLYLRARYYNPLDGRFVSRDTWDGDVNNPLSLNRWMYVVGNPINYVDPTGRSPFQDEGELTAEEIKATYLKNPDGALQLIQQEYDIKLPPGYTYRLTSGGTIFGPYGSNTYDNVWGVEFWFTEFNGIGNIIEISDSSCGIFSTTIPDQARHIDYSVYITMHSFDDWNYNPNDIAGVMIHEGVHAWQESVTRNHLVFPGQEGDPSSLSWRNAYLTEMEFQADDYALDAHDAGRIKMSWRFRFTMNLHKALNWTSKEFPYPLPPNVP